jgi:hypothetical protein
MKDKKSNTGGEVGGLLNSIKALVKIDSESTLGMDSQQRLETAKLYFHNAEQTRNIIKEGQKSLLEVVDDQLALCKEELKQIDEKLKSVDDEEKREVLQSQRDACQVYSWARDNTHLCAI